MNRKKWIRIGLGLLIAGALLFGVGAAMGGVGMVTGRASHRGSGEFLEEVKSIAVAAADFDVRIEATDGEHVEYDYDARSEDEVELAVEDGVLTIRQKDRGWRDALRLWSWDECWLVVRLPASLEGLEVRTTSGDIWVNGAQVDGGAVIGATSGEIEVYGAFGSLKVGTTSGDIGVGASTVGGAAEIRATSGEIEIEGLNAQGALSVRATSGSVEVTDASASDFEIGSTSGEIVAKQVSASGAAGKIALRSTSGDIVIEEGDGKEIALATTSGEVRGWLVGAMRDYSITSGTVSGNSSLPKELGGGSRKLSVTTTSGDIEVGFEAD